VTATGIDLATLPAVLKVAEVARLLRTGRNQTYAAIESGEIRAVRIGRSIRVPRGEVARLLGLSPEVGDSGPAPPGNGDGRPLEEDGRPVEAITRGRGDRPSVVEAANAREGRWSR
jgi:excisionase family DNA binding protein